MFYENVGYFGHMGFNHGGVMFWIIGLLIILILVDMFRTNKKVHNKNEDDSLTILKSRFARGDITEEEYTSKKNILTK